MHVAITDDTCTKTEGIICIERETGTAIILFGEIDILDKLVAIAKAMKVPRVMLVVPEASINQLTPMGWHEATDLKVLLKE